MRHSTFNAYNLGDNLVHLHFLRRLALANPGHGFTHYANERHLHQLRPVIYDLTQIELLGLGAMTGDSSACVNSWRGDGGYFYSHPERNDFVAFHKDWFARLSERFGLKSPIASAADMLFDYPALKQTQPQPKFDYLIINSPPHSGQLRGYNAHDFVSMVAELVANGKRCVTTTPTGRCDCTNDGTSGLDVTQIGQLSQSAKCIVGVATGPLWTTFNVWNQDTPRVILLDNERLDLVEGVRHVRSVGEAMEYL